MVDGRGTAIGSVIELGSGGNGEVRILRRENRLLVLLRASEDGSFHDIGGDRSLYFESTDCSGQAYLRNNPGGSLYRSAAPEPGVAGPHTTFNYAGDPFETRALMSRRNSPTECETFAVEQLESVGPVQVLHLSGYVPPFSIK